jgi:hypothetical protein
VPTVCRIAAATSLVLALMLCSSCGPAAPDRSPSGAAVSPPLDPEAAQASQKIGARLSTLINEATARFKELDYEYNEDLLTKLDAIEAYLSGKAAGPPPRFLPKLDEPEEIDHFRETIRRWESKTGKNLRAAIDPLKAEVAARKPGAPYHPEFHKHFSAAFDDLIHIEVDEMRERRNTYIHKNAEPIFNEFREKYPAAVREQEDMLNKPPYR